MRVRTLSTVIRGRCHVTEMTYTWRYGSSREGGHRRRSLQFSLTLRGSLATSFEPSRTPTICDTYGRLWLTLSPLWTRVLRRSSRWQDGSLMVRMVRTSVITRISYSSTLTVVSTYQVTLTSTSPYSLTQATSGVQTWFRGYGSTSY